MNEFKTSIGDIPCICRVTYYKPYEPAKLTGAMEDAEEAIPSEFDFIILYLDGSPNTGLQAVMSDKDIERLQDEYEASVLADKHGKDF